MKDKRGITLVALVITIIIMMILAGVSIGALVGENGIINTAKDAKTKQNESKIQEEIEIAWKARMIRKEEMFDENSNVDYQLAIIATELNFSLKDIGKVAAIKYTRTPPLYQLVFRTLDNNVYEFELNGDGKIQNSIDVTSNETAILANYQVTETNFNTIIIEFTESEESNGSQDLLLYKISDTIEKTATVKEVIDKQVQEIIIPQKVKLNALGELDKNGEEYKITTIGASAFYGCANLKKVELNDGLERLNQVAFARCSKLPEIVFPESLISINEGVFMECTSLTKIVIPDNTVTIGPGAFNKCTKLREITIGTGIRSFGNDVFKNSGLTSAIFRKPSTFRYYAGPGAGYTTVDFTENSYDNASFFRSGNEILNIVE